MSSKYQSFFHRRLRRLKNSQKNTPLHQNAHILYHKWCCKLSSRRSTDTCSRFEFSMRCRWRLKSYGVFWHIHPLTVTGVFHPLPSIFQVQELYIYIYIYTYMCILVLKKTSHFSATSGHNFISQMSWTSALYFLYVTVPTADVVQHCLWKRRGFSRDTALSYI